VRIRDATTGDKALVLELVAEFEASLPRLPYVEDPPEEDWERISKRIVDGVALIAEDDEGAVGFADGEFERGHVWVQDVYVRERARRRGLGRALLDEIADRARARGITHLELEVDVRNGDALRFYEQLGFAESGKVLRIALDRLNEERPKGESAGAVHAQTDDPDAVQKVVDQFLPRLERGATAAVTGSRTWTTVRVTPFSLDTLRKLAVELSYRFSVAVVLTLEEEAVVRFVILDQGRIVDEYLSVPEYYGALPPGDALALRANPTVVSRLTGADAARVRAVARTGDAPSELPPARELYAELAAVLGLEP
jgi:ribosomal protein S18 acetylase RimI-like enzyme